MNRKLLLTTLLSLSTFSYADISEGSGIGETAEIAKKNAIDNAVKAKVGEFLLSKEQLNNSEISQKIISYSNAHVKNVETKSEEQKDGQYYVTVAVDLDSSKLVEELKQAEPTVTFNKIVTEEQVKQLEEKNTLEAPKATNETASESSSSTAKEEPKEMTFEQQIDELLIKPIKENKVVMIEPLAEAPIQQKVKKGEDSSEAIFELPMRISFNKDYIKSVQKVYLAMQDEQGIQLLLKSWRIEQPGEHNALDVNSLHVNEEQFTLLAKKLNALKEMPLVIVLKDQDDLNIRTIKYDSRMEKDGYLIEFNNNFNDSYYVASRLAEGKQINPFILDGNVLMFSSGSIEFKMLFKLRKDEVDEINNGGKILVKYGQ